MGRKIGLSKEQGLPKRKIFVALLSITNSKSFSEIDSNSSRSASKIKYIKSEILKKNEEKINGYRIIDYVFHSALPMLVNERKDSGKKWICFKLFMLLRYLWKLIRALYIKNL